MDLAVLFLRLAAVLALFRGLGLPLARRAFPGLGAASYAVAAAAGFTVAAHATWLLTQAGLRLGPLTVGAGLVALGAAAVLCWRGRPLRLLLPRPAEVVWHHLAFLVLFAFALLVTARNPAVDPDSERFMDHAMVKAVLAARTLPLEDPWLAGERVSYYDYGYFATAYLCLLVGPPEQVFLVAVALVYAALGSGVLALGRDLAGPWAGLLAGFLVSVAGNLQAVVSTLQQGLGVAFDWFKAARVLDPSITEFPLFSLLWGDLHPYVLALALWPLLLAAAATLGRGEADAVTAGLAGVAFAALSATQTWDAVPVAALLVLSAAFAGRRPLVLAGAALAIGLLLALPFLLHAPTGGRGLALVRDRSTVRQLLTVWGIPAALLGAAAAADLVRHARHPALARPRSPPRR